MLHDSWLSTAGKILAICGLLFKVGLDPAAPAFSRNPPGERLGFEDARFVDVIHTSVRLLGMVENIGHADFYPSGGMHQPRCPFGILEEVTGKCDHMESYVYFAETIRNRSLYPAKACGSLREALEERCTGEKSVYMGEDTLAGAPRGIYHVDVNHLKGETPSAFALPPSVMPHKARNVSK